MVGRTTGWGTGEGITQEDMQLNSEARPAEEGSRVSFGCSDPRLHGGGAEHAAVSQEMVLFKENCGEAAV